MRERRWRSLKGKPAAMKAPRPAIRFDPPRQPGFIFKMRVIPDKIYSPLSVE
jgi:hypothetical protein